MFTWREHFIKLINICSAFIITKPKPFAIEFGPEVFKFFQIVLNGYQQAGCFAHI